MEVTASVARESEQAGRNQGAGRKSERECRGRMRGHERGLKLEALLFLQRVGTKHGGVTWYSAAGLAEELDCSTFWARNILRALVEDGWLLPTRWNGRPAHRVRSHAEWAKTNHATPNCSLRNAAVAEQQSCVGTQETCGKAQQSCADPATKLRGGSNSPPRNSLNAKDFSGTPVGSDSQEVHGHQYSQQQIARAKPEAAAASCEETKTFRQAADTSRTIFGRQFGSPGKNRSLWSQLAAEHGTEVMVRAVEIWASEITPDYAATIANPVALFLKQCEEPLESAIGEMAPPKSDPGRELVEVCGEMVPRATAEYVREQHRQKDERGAKWRAENREREIDRRVNEEMQRRYGDRWIHGLIPPGPEIDAEEREVRAETEKQLGAQMYREAR